MPTDNEDIPALSDTLTPPTVHGTAELSGRAYAGTSPDTMLGWIGPSARSPTAAPAAPGAGQLFDASIIHQLGFRRTEGLCLQARALAQSRLFRVLGKDIPGPALRVLAIYAPGDLMVNTPLDFITNELNVRLDLLFVCPDQPLPDTVPDHDVAVFCVSEADPPQLRRLRHLFANWPRPALNDPAFLSGLARDTLARSLATVPEIRGPTAVAVSRTELNEYLNGCGVIDGFGGRDNLFPCLIRPSHSHAGAGLERLGAHADLSAYLKLSLEDSFFVTEFEDYANADGLYRKWRVAFIDRQPFLCHMAVSSHWMIHYLNAGMTESAAKRAMEQEAMATFDTGFARRHAAAFAALHQQLGFDYYSIDCSETRDGRLLVFEADTAAVIHLMDPPDLFPYKPPQMRRVFDAFGAMLHRRARLPWPVMPAEAQTALPVLA
jgi:hypothetical protein